MTTAASSPAVVSIGDSAISGGPAAMPPLAPAVTINGKVYVMATPLMAGIELADLGVLEADLSVERERVMAALDFLVSGI